MRERNKRGRRDRDKAQINLGMLDMVGTPSSSHFPHCRKSVTTAILATGPVLLGSGSLICSSLSIALPPES